MLNSLFAVHQDGSSNERRLLLVLCAEVVLQVRFNLIEGWYPWPVLAEF